MSPDRAEVLLTILVLFALFWQSWAFRDPGFSRGGGDRFVLDQALEVKLPPASASLAAACAFPRTAESDWQTKLCKDVKAGDGANAPKIIANQLQEIQEGFAAPMRGDLRKQQSEILAARAGLRPQNARDPANQSDEGDTAGEQDGASYRRAYGLESDTHYSRPLACAMDWLNGYAKQAGKEVEARLLAAAVLNGNSGAVRKWAAQKFRLPDLD